MKPHGASNLMRPVIGSLALILCTAALSGCQLSPCAIESECAEAPDVLAADASTPRDAGTPMDAGTPGDGGTPQDAGTPMDAGTPGISCDRAVHDAKLGTLRLHAQYALAESVTSPQGVIALTVVARGSGFELYGIHGPDKSLYGLGTWPRVARSARPLASIIASEDLEATTYLSNFLVNDGRRLMAGYIKGRSRLEGKVFVHDLQVPEQSVHLEAPGNESALGVGTSSIGGTTSFLVEGLGLGKAGSTDSDLAIHRLDTESLESATLATFEPEWIATGATSAVTTRGITVFGYFSGADAQTHLRAVAPAAYERALDTGTPIPLAKETEIHRGTPEGVWVAGFGDSVAIHRGTLPDNALEVDTHDVLLVPLSVGSGTHPKVQTGAARTLLTSQDTCTNVTSLASMGADLLVGISDKNGQRLVRIRAR